MYKMEVKPRLKRIGTLCLALVLSLTATVGWTSAHPVPVAATSITELESQKAEIQSQLEEVNSKIDDLQDQIDQEESYQAELTNQIALYKQQIQLLSDEIDQLEVEIDDKNAEIEQLEADIEQLEEEIAAKQVEIEETFEQFKTRMVALYQAGETSSLAMLLSSSSFADFVTNIRLMQAVSASDEQLVDKLRTQKAEQEATKQQVEDTKQEVEDALAEVQAYEESVILQREEQKAAQSNLEVAYSKSKSAQEDLEELKAQYEDDLAAAKAEDEAVENEIQEFYAEQARKAAEAAAAAAAAAAASGSTTTTTTTTVDTGDLSFRWPLPGYSTITSGYGSRWGSFHTGIDISGGGVYGAPIVAAESGTVILASSHYSYGNYVIIDHGGGYTTLYAHMSSIATSVGSYVSKGQTIGYVGSTGNSTGPHLHFEVRINGSHQNPTGFVSP
jgi:septal ring factor EnvC (AmiA/AmiB activator)